MKNKMSKFLVFSLLLFIPALSLADTEGAPEWVDFYGAVTINGVPAAVGSVVKAYDPDGIACGEYVVGISGAANDSAGIYGFMHVYRDDTETPAIDEGAEPGDTIVFTVNGFEATPTLISGTLTWTSSGDQQEVDLAVTGVNISFSAVVLPTALAGAPGDTIRFQIGVRNDGNGLDFYGISSLSDTSASPGWYTLDQTELSYAEPGETTYVYFDAVIPVWGGGGDTAFVIEYTIYSHIDPTVVYTNSVMLYKSTTDIDDDPGNELPGRFTLFQNYPNPFNPSTTIAFDLPARTTVQLEVINILGQVTETRDLGTLGAGVHEVEFDASHLASGVYLYRIVTDYSSQTRKMVLAK